MSDYCSRCGRTTSSTAAVLRQIEAAQTELRNYKTLRAVLVILMVAGLIVPFFSSLNFFWPAGFFFVSGVLAVPQFLYLTFYRARDIGSGFNTVHLPVIPALRYQLDELRDQLAKAQP